MEWPTRQPAQLWEVAEGLAEGELGGIHRTRVVLVVPVMAA